MTHAYAAPARRSLSLGLALMLTVATLSGLQALAQPEAASPLLARAGTGPVVQAAPSAARA